MLSAPEVHSGVSPEKVLKARWSSSDQRAFACFGTMAFQGRRSLHGGLGRPSYKLAN